MSDVSKIKIGSTSYDVADKTARDGISVLLDEMGSIYDEIPTVAHNTTGKNFTNVSTSGVNVRYALYDTLQRIDNLVTLNIRIQLNSSTGNLKLKGLPYNMTKGCNKTFKDICASDQGNLLQWSIYEYNGETILEISKIDGGSWTHGSGEMISFVATYFLN